MGALRRPPLEDLSSRCSGRWHWNGPTTTATPAVAGCAPCAATGEPSVGERGFKETFAALEVAVEADIDASLRRGSV